MSSRIEQIIEEIEEYIAVSYTHLEAGNILPGIFLVTLAPDEKNQLEIHRYLLLLQPVFHRENLFVVGISKDYEEALELVEEITQEVYKDVYKRQDVETVLKKALKNMMF